MQKARKSASSKLLGEQARLARETEKIEARWLESTEQLEVQLRKLNTR